MAPCNASSLYWLPAKQGLARVKALFEAGAQVYEAIDLIPTKPL